MYAHVHFLPKAFALRVASSISDLNRKTVLTLMTSKEKPENFDPVIRVAGVIVRVDDECLFLRRALYKKFGAGQWALPVGKIEPEEDFLEGAIRELQEESGLKLEPHELKHIDTYYHSPEADRNVRLEYVTFEAKRKKKPTIILNKESQEYIWCHVDEVLNLDLTDGEAFCFKDYISKSIIN